MEHVEALLLGAMWLCSWRRLGALVSVGVTVAHVVIRIVMISCFIAPDGTPHSISYPSFHLLSGPYSPMVSKRFVSGLYGNLMGRQGTCSGRFVNTEPGTAAMMKRQTLWKTGTALGTCAIRKTGLSPLLENMISIHVLYLGLPVIVTTYPI